MKGEEQGRYARSNETKGGLSRRRAMGAAGLLAVGGLSDSILGKDERERGDASPQMNRMRVHFERMQNAGDDERQQMLAEFAAQRREEAINRYEEQLGCSDAEWQVIRPRLAAVYKLTRSTGRTDASGQLGPTELETRTRELQQLLREQDAAAERIKAGLTALRAARERARQELAQSRQALRQLLTLRQEAQLVLSELLD